MHLHNDMCLDRRTRRTGPTDRQKDGRTDRPTDRWTDGATEQQMDGTEWSGVNETRADPNQTELDYWTGPDRTGPDRSGLDQTRVD